ncbi:phage tail assembly chaperone [Ensifer adhaerens]|uniref:phage tail assembly chaperone n=1 Tax=Ensifer TaxID=106591 RepID=UPI00178509EE|nr:phage tail assembly chaperone [Ensifer sp. ENS03]MBD9555673.1 phage tail assembly chaperone [Ensifer sp. ENS03]
MTYQRPAYEQVTIAHGGNTVTLRPSLRAAATLVERHGFPTLFRALDDLNLAIISEIILTAATSRQDAAAFLSFPAGRPLFPFFLAVRQPLAELVSMFKCAPDPKAKPSTGTGKLIVWSDEYRGLYRAATGALGWTPEAAWNATPTEINEACIGRFGTGDDTVNAPDPEQAARNVATGLEPEFDRNALEALRGSIKRAGR